MLEYFPKAKSYLLGLDINSADLLDKKAHTLISDPAAYERASQALRRRFVRGAAQVEGIDRNRRRTLIKREYEGGKYRYFVQGENGNWSEPEERIWVVVMYGLWQDTK